MVDSLFQMEVPPVHLLVRATVVYLFVLLLLRLSGKRQLGQMGATEFVAILLISNAVQNAMNGGDNSLVGGLWLALILVALSTLISLLTYRSRFFESVFEGTPTLLINQGKIIRVHLDKERLSENELRVLLRKQGVHNVHEIRTAVLEADGTVSITKMNETTPTEN